MAAPPGGTARCAWLKRVRRPEGGFIHPVWAAALIRQWAACEGPVTPPHESPGGAKRCLTLARERHTRPHRVGPPTCRGGLGVHRPGPGVCELQTNGRPRVTPGAGETLARVLPLGSLWAWALGFLRPSSASGRGQHFLFQACRQVPRLIPLRLQGPGSLPDHHLALEFQAVLGEQQ